MDYRIENLQYGLHSTLWVLGKDVRTPGCYRRCRHRHTTSWASRSSIHVCTAV